MEEIEVTFRGDAIFGLPSRVFKFLKTPNEKGIKYEWVNMPDIMKEVLALSQYEITSKVPLSDFELLQEVGDIYEAFAVENENLGT